MTTLSSHGTLGRLPLELRFAIYADVFDHQGLTYVMTDSRYKSWTHTERPTRPTLLHGISKAIQQEAEMVYGTLHSCKYELRMNLASSSTFGVMKLVKDLDDYPAIKKIQNDVGVGAATGARFIGWCNESDDDEEAPLVEASLSRSETLCNNNEVLIILSWSAWNNPRGNDSVFNTALFRAIPKLDRYCKVEFQIFQDPHRKPFIEDFSAESRMKAFQTLWSPSLGPSVLTQRFVPITECSSSSGFISAYQGSISFAPYAWKLGQS